MSKPLKVDDLNTSAKPLAQCAEGIEGISEPEIPDAGVSSGPIGAFIASLAGGLSTIAVSAANAADAVQASATGYKDTDHHNGAHIGAAENSLPGGAVH